MASIQAIPATVDRQFLASEKAYPNTGLLNRLVKLIFKIGSWLKSIFHSPDIKDARKINLLKLKDDLAANQIIALRDVLKKYSIIDLSSGPDTNFTELVMQLKKLIETNLTKDENTIDRTKKIRLLLNDALQNPVYQQNKDRTDDPVVNFLEELSTAIRRDAKGFDELADFGGFYLSDDSTASFGDIGCAMDKAVGKATSDYTRNNGWAKWALRHPIKGIHALLGNTDPLDYNPYEAGNIDITVGKFKLDEASITFYHGPTPTGEKIFEAHLNRQKKLGYIHLHHNLQHPNKNAEEFRVYEMLRLDDKFKNFRLFSTPMDGKAWIHKIKKGSDLRFLKFTNPKDFYLKYAKYAIANDLDQQVDTIEDVHGDAYKYYEQDKTHDNGFYVGKEVMKDDQFKLAFSSASNAMQEIYEKDQKHFDDRNKDIESQKRISKMMQVAAQGFVAIGALLNTLYDVKDKKQAEKAFEAVFSQACKQDIDRGVVLNIITGLYYQLLIGKPLSKKELQEIVGAVIARAYLAENRIIIKERYLALSDFLHFVGDNQDILKSHLQKYSKAFNPAEDQPSYSFESL